MKTLIALATLILISAAFSGAQTPIYVTFNQSTSTVTFDFNSVPVGQYFQAQSISTNGYLAFGTSGGVVAANRLLSNTLIDRFGDPLEDAKINGFVRQHENFQSSQPLTMIGFGNNTGQGSFTVAGGTATYSVSGLLSPFNDSYFSNISTTTFGHGSLQGGGSFVLVPIPEPSTYALIAGIGILGLALWRRRRTA